MILILIIFEVEELPNIVGFLSTEEVTNAVGQTGDRYEGEIKRLKKLTERLDAEKQHYRRLYERQLEVRYRDQSRSWNRA